MALSERDLQTLTTLAAEQADNRALSMSARERWFEISMRLSTDTHTAADLRAAGELAIEDAKLQRDAQTRERYIELGKRAFGG